MPNLITMKNDLIELEQTTLSDLRVSKRLANVFRQTDGLRRFAECFYYIRCKFVQLNFVIGSRCPNHEKYWSGLVRNLHEEMGGDSGQTHNELYRRFLHSCGAQTDTELDSSRKEPQFSKKFNKDWMGIAQNEELDVAISSISLYEALDEPDYKFLLQTLRNNTSISEENLLFFAVHAQADHYKLFDDYTNEKLSEHVIMRSLKLVHSLQSEMWTGLLDHLECQNN